MWLINKLKDFFYIGEISEQKFAAAAAAAADRIIEYTVSLVLRTDLIKPQLARIEAGRVLPQAEMAKEYIKVYSELEKFILEHEPLVIKRKFTQEELRKDIREKLGALGAGYDLLLTGDIEQAVKLCKVMSESILNQTTTILGQATSQRFMDKTGVVEFRAAEFRNPEQVISSFQKLSSDLYSAISDTIGKEKAKSIFELEYKKLQEVYGFIPYTIEILKALPLGILEEEKIRNISRLELEEKVKERTRELEKSTEERVKLAAAAAETDHKRAAELEKAYKELEKTQDASLNIMERSERRRKELDNAYKELRETQAKLVQSEKMAALGELGAGAAHELNNPLAGIMGFTELVLNDVKDNSVNREEIIENLETVMQDAYRCKNIVANLLSYARGKEPEKTENDISGIIEESLDIVERQGVLKGIKVIKGYGMDMPKVFVDKGQMVQVFVNILVNAHKAMPNGGEIFIKSWLDKNYVAVEFKDTGIGIEKENLGRVFDPFFTTYRPGGGTGLGLSVCYSIIKSHRGEIESRSEGKDKGASLIVRIPV